MGEQITVELNFAEALKKHVEGLSLDDRATLIAAMLLNKGCEQFGPDFANGQSAVLNSPFNPDFPLALNTVLTEIEGVGNVPAVVFSRVLADPAKSPEDFETFATLVLTTEGSPMVLHGPESGHSVEVAAILRAFDFMMTQLAGEVEVAQ